MADLRIPLQQKHTNVSNEREGMLATDRDSESSYIYMKVHQVNLEP